MRNLNDHIQEICETKRTMRLVRFSNVHNHEFVISERQYNFDRTIKVFSKAVSLGKGIRVYLGRRIKDKGVLASTYRFTQFFKKLYSGTSI
jgi:hypothetical protein